MLSELENSLGRVRVSAPSYQDLVSLYYLEKMLLVDKELSTEEKFLIFKNFCEIYKNINSNEDVTSLMKKVNRFRKDLKRVGIRVEDLRNNQNTFPHSILVSFFIECLRGLFLFPFFTFFIPIRSILIAIAERKRAQALSNSVVKGESPDPNNLQSALTMFWLQIKSSILYFWRRW